MLSKNILKLNGKHLLRYLTEFQHFNNHIFIAKRIDINYYKKSGYQSAKLKQY